MSSPFDLVVRAGNVVTPDGVRQADVAVAHGRIVAIRPTIAESAGTEVDATGRYVFPGILDAHVHFNEPGRTDWEGLATGSTALAAGGGTAFFDMPLNSEPPVLEADRLLEKRRLAEAKSCLDFGLWGGLTPLNLEQLGGLRDAGAIGLKAFMSASGIDSFPRVDERTLALGMRQAARLGLLVAVHAEDDALATKHTSAQKSHGHTDAAAWLASRPVEVELAAIRCAVDLAGETGCRLHIVHVSSPEGAALVAEARRQGVDVTAETCPHYLLLNSLDVERIGAPAKCAPPIRDEARRNALWSEVRAGRIQTIGSDHSPSPAAMKESADFFEIWGGIGGCQHGFVLTLSACSVDPARDFPVLAGAFARNVADRFGLGQTKGSLAEGKDADFSIVTIGPEREIRRDDVLTRHAISPYVGRSSRVQLTHTYVRGHAIIVDGRPASLGFRGQFLRPESR